MALCRNALIACCALALASPAALARSDAHGGWQCTADEDSIAVYRFLTEPRLEPGVTITDSFPTSELTDSVLRYVMAPQDQYFIFTVRFGSDHRVVRDNARLSTQGLKVEILTGETPIASGTLGVSQDFDLMNADAIPVIQAIGNPANTSLTVRLKDSEGKKLADYAVPLAGFRDAGHVAASLMGTPGSETYSKSCP